MSAIYKTIVSGCLEFGNQRSYDQVLNLFQHRTENYYRNDILIDAEEAFQESSFTLNLPRFIKESSEKSWKNTLNLLNYIAEYAIAGDVRMWVIHERKLILDETIEPVGDKSVIKAFMKGRELVKETGMEEEAMKALNRAIDKFERHGKAYERRGYVNFKLRNFDDAMYDFTKSVDIHPNNPEAYWGRANVKIIKKDLRGAIEDLEMARKTSIPHQPIFWSARRLRGELHLQLGEFQQAIFELKMVTNRPFTETDPNYKWQKNALYNYGKALFEVGEFGEAVKAFNKMFDFDVERKEAPPKADQFLNRGLARQKAGETGYMSDIKEAAGLGSEKAAELLEALV
ncbi:MAG TPA: tetratricopeptide repeat protein [Bacteroidetes bacterium]|nr:tetratricopeptide repeat protein [Bacteroidota bacterium]